MSSPFRPVSTYFAPLLPAASREIFYGTIRAHKMGSHSFIYSAANARSHRTLRLTDGWPTGITCAALLKVACGRSILRVLDGVACRPAEKIDRNSRSSFPVTGRRCK